MTRYRPPPAAQEEIDKAQHGCLVIQAITLALVPFVFFLMFPNA